MHISGSAKPHDRFPALIRVFALLCVFGLVADANPAQAEEKKAELAPLGSMDNPVKCDDPGGERYYLARLVDPEGREIDFSRMGSFGAGPHGNILDGYEVTIGDKKIEVFMDMYHRGYYEERPIEGLYLRCRVCWDLVIRADGLRYAIGGKQPYEGEFTRTEEKTGKPIARVTLKKGKLQGVATRYYENGKVHSLTPYTDSLEQGPAQYYSEEGQLTAMINFTNGKRQGEATWYYPDGSIESVYTYDKGQLHGPCHEKHETGKKKMTGQFKAGKREGEWLYYNPKGEVAGRDEFKDGERVKPEEGDD